MILEGVLSTQIGCSLVTVIISMGKSLAKSAVKRLMLEAAKVVMVEIPELISWKCFGFIQLLQLNLYLAII